jgi:hypothetical protein
MQARMSRSEYYHYENDFNSFLRLIKFANVTFQRIDVEKEGETQPKDEIKVNYSKSFSDFRDSLYRKLEEIKREIVQGIIGQHSRFEKLVFIASKVAELENAMSKLTRNGDKFSHAEFSFSNISKHEGAEIVMTEDDVQDYYEMMDKYSQELLSHLKLVQQSVNASSNGDFPLPVSAPPDPNEPTSQKPLAFFEHFFVNQGFSKFRIDFFNLDDEGYYNVVNVDKGNEIITYQDFDPETDEEYTSTLDFKKDLLNKLLKEFYKAKNCIDSRIDQFTEESQIKLYLKLLLYEIKHINAYLNKYDEAQKYESNKLALNGLIRFVFQKYEPFVKELETVDFFKQNISSQTEQPATPTALPITQKMLPQREVILAFKWTASSYERTIKFHQALVHGGFISNAVDVSDFSKAFYGEQIEHPLNIRWMKKVKGKLSKPLILYLFDRLMEEGLIERVTGNQDRYRKIQRIFTDHEGKPLQHFSVSSAGIQKRKIDYTSAEKQINAIIATLKS